MNISMRMCSISVEMICVGSESVFNNSGDDDDDDDYYYNPADYDFYDDEYFCDYIFVTAYLLLCN